MDYTGLDDYNSVTDEEESEQGERELEEVDVADLQVEEVRHHVTSSRDVIT